MSRYFFYLSIIFSTSIVGCSFFSSQKRELARAERAIENKNPLEALRILEVALTRNPYSAESLELVRFAAKVSFYELKDFEAALKYHRLLILKSPDSEERLECQKKIVSILYEKIKNYSDSIAEVTQLLNHQLHLDEVFEYRMILAKCYFQLNKFDQAKIEVDLLMKQNLSDVQNYQALLFKGNLYMTDKQHEAAIEVYDQLLEQFPAKSIEEGVAASLASVYEDIEKFEDAISVLESYQTTGPSAEFIEFKIKKLKERMKNLPGARGLKK